MSDLASAIEAAKELFEGLEERYGPVSHRKMFGGAGLYAEGRIFALIIRGELMLKADPKTAPDLASDFEAAGAERWAYESARRKAPVAMPYWTLPSIAVDDPEEACQWAGKCIEATR